MKFAAPLLLCALASASAVPPLAVPFFRQEKNGCGAASVAMVVHYWRPDGAPAHASIYGALIDGRRRGIQLAHMKEYLQQAGFQAFTLRGVWTDIAEQLGKGRPLIVTLREARTRRLHFAVLTGVEDGHVWLNDPTRKRARRAERAWFEKQWAGAGNWILLAAPEAGR